MIHLSLSFQLLDFFFFFGQTQVLGIELSSLCLKDKDCINCAISSTTDLQFNLVSSPPSPSHAKNSSGEMWRDYIQQVEVSKNSSGVAGNLTQVITV